MAHWHVLERRVVTEAILAGRTPPAGPSVAAAGETEATGAASAAGAMLAECCRRSLARLLLYLIRRRLTRGEDAAEPRVRTPLHGHGGSHTNRTERENIARARLIWIRRRAARTRRDAVPRASPFLCRPWTLLCPPRSSPRSGRPRPPARAAALLPHRPLRRRRRTPSRRGRRLSSRLAATGGSWC